MLKQKISSLARDLYPKVVSNRRHLHANPELSFQEHNTSAFVKRALDELEIPWTAMAGTGVVGLIEGSKPSAELVALRADMDALPIAEANNVEYVSKNPGVMHACGHDAHTSSLLGTAAILQSMKDDFGGKVRLIFREFPFDPRAEAGFMLARCAGDNYFPMVDVLFKQQRNWAPVQDAQAALLQIARLAGFSQESFEACLTDQKLLDDIRSVRERGANDFKVEATPTFFINGNKYSGALSIDQMSAIIDSMA